MIFAPAAQDRARLREAKFSFACQKRTRKAPAISTRWTHEKGAARPFQTPKGESKHPSLPLARAERKPLDQKKKPAPRHQREIIHKRGTITMQNIDLICIGKLNAKYFAEGVAEYQKRLAAFASFRIIELPEEKIEEKNASDAVVKKALDKEGKAILGSVRKGAAIVAMCIEGKQISSDELAQFLADRANSGAGDVAFVIGSSHGLSDEVKRAAALKFSMGRITMPHQLARLVLTEQIYRACTINAGMKYHK